MAAKDQDQNKVNLLKKLDEIKELIDSDEAESFICFVLTKECSVHIKNYAARHEFPMIAHAMASSISEMQEEIYKTYVGPMQDVAELYEKLGRQGVIDYLTKELPEDIETAVAQGKVNQRVKH